MNDIFTLDRNGEKNGGRVCWTEAQITYLIEQYNLNHSIPTLANEFNVSSQTIREILRKKKVKILTLQELQVLDYPRNSSYFNNIDTPAKAYWLGFLYADGYIDNNNRITLGLKYDDKTHVQKFLNAIGAINHKIGKSQKKDNDKIFYTAHASIRDKQLHDDLIDKGCVYCKTNIMNFPTAEQVPEYLLSHFIRGYFDGDGSLYYTQSGKNKIPNWKIGFTCGSKSFLETLKKILGKDNIAIENRESYFILQISGNKQLITILEYIYQDSDSSIYLQRKKDIYDKFLLQSIGGEPGNPGCE